MRTLGLFTVIALFAMQSCVIESSPAPQGFYGRDGRDGKTYFKLNYAYGAPDYIDAGGVVPYNFYWDSYYRTSPGYYTIYVEYFEYTRRGTIVYPFEVTVEVFSFAGELGGYRYNGRDGDNVYFELILFPDGYQYYHDVELKSDTNSPGKMQISYNEETKGDVRIATTYYKLPAKLIEN